MNPIQIISKTKNSKQFIAGGAFCTTAKTNLLALLLTVTVITVTVKDILPVLVSVRKKKKIKIHIKMMII